MQAHAAELASSASGTPEPSASGVIGTRPKSITHATAACGPTMREERRAQSDDAAQQTAAISPPTTAIT